MRRTLAREFSERLSLPCPSLRRASTAGATTSARSSLTDPPTAIEAFSPSHVKVLHFLWTGRGSVPPVPPITNYGQAIQTALPELKVQIDLLQHILNDLTNRGFSNLSGPQAAHPQNPVITNFGIEFLHFVSEPR